MTDYDALEVEQDYKRLLLDFADHTGQLEELSNYIHDLSKDNEFHSIDLESLHFELNQ